MKLIELESIPKPPKGFEKSNWDMYCNSLLTAGLLCEVYLKGVKELCWWEIQFESIQEQIENDGSVNYYYEKERDEKGEKIVKAIQRNGLASHADKCQEHILKIRDKYGFTATSTANLVKPKSQESEEKPRAKNF